MLFRDFPNEIKSFEAVVKLRDSKLTDTFAFADCTPGAPRMVGGANTVSIVADAVADAPGPAATVAESERNRIRSLTGQDPDRTGYGAAVHRHLDMVAIVEAVALRHVGTDGDDVVPCQCGERLWQFLKPADIGKAAVPYGGVEPKHDIDIAAVVCIDGLYWILRLGRDRPATACDEAVMQRLSPLILEGVAKSRAPCLLDRCIRSDIAVTKQHLDDLMVRSHVIERGDSGLDDRRGAVDSQSIAPAFEAVRRCKLIGAQASGLVALLPDMNSEGHLRHCLGEIQRAGRTVGRIGIDDDKCFDRAGVHVVNQGRE